jgi:hypothetical protein
MVSGGCQSQGSSIAQRANDGIRKVQLEQNLRSQGRTARAIGTLRENESVTVRNSSPSDQSLTSPGCSAVFVATEPGGIGRIISARKASAHGRKIYEEGNF